MTAAPVNQALIGRRATLRDVARAAGTTPMTVSNVVNGRAGQVGKPLADRVMKACQTLGYRPHANARRLRTDRRQAIGVIIIDPSPYYVSDPLTAAVLAGLNARLGARGYSIVIHGVSPTALDSVSMLRQVESDGVCLMLSGDARARSMVIDRVATLQQPVVLIQDRMPEDATDCASVLQDDFGGGRAVAEHLLDGGARRIVMLKPALEWPAMERREQGVRSALAGRGGSVAFDVVRGRDEGFEATQAALSRHIEAHGAPDALIGGNDQMAIAGMRLLSDRGLRIPQDVRVTGFNGLEFWRYATPELSTVFSPAYALGETAADAMLARLAEGAFPFREQVLPVRFAAHGSSASPQSESPARSISGSA
ncbi:MAG: hypothetical protein BGP06_20955 [Rhizobiales bacterium 65-9]|nr:MAG: hypothetical protein BGP06_20955 [Rhizobiales bacterium 65-9]